MNYYRMIFLTSLSILFLCISGCGTPAERSLNRQIDLMNQMAAAIENEAPKDVLEKLKDQMEANGERLKDLELTEEERNELIKKYKEPLEDATKRLMQATMKRAFNFGPKGGFPGFDGPFPDFGR